MTDTISDIDTRFCNIYVTTTSTCSAIQVLQWAVDQTKTTKTSKQKNSFTNMQRSSKRSAFI